MAGKFSFSNFFGMTEDEDYSTDLQGTKDN